MILSGIWLQIPDNIQSNLNSINLKLDKIMNEYKTLSKNAFSIKGTINTEFNPSLQRLSRKKTNLSSKLDTPISTHGIVNDLPEKFIGRGEVRGRQFTQIECSIKAYLYQVQSNGEIYWEVFKRRENLRFGNIIYPSSNAFGRWAWTTLCSERALQIFNTINQ